MSDWIVPIAAAPDAPACLVCLPHAGGGPSFFKPWAGVDDVEILAVQPPGRESRAAELLITDLPRLIRQTANVLAGICERRPTALFGHSSGARYAFEVCRALERANRGPALLCISGISPPDHSYWTVTTQKLLADPVTAYLKLGADAVPGQVEGDPAMVETFTTLIRTESRLYAGLGTEQPVPLRCPVTTFAAEDDAIADPQDMAGWRAWSATPDEFTMHRYPGDHFYIRQQFPAVLDDLLLDLARVTATSPALG